MEVIGLEGVTLFREERRVLSRLDLVRAARCEVEVKGRTKKAQQTLRICCAFLPALPESF